MNSIACEPKKSVIITGANGGLGFQCARTILAAGSWHVVLACRPGGKTVQALEQLRQMAPADGRVCALPVDFSSLQSVRELVDRFVAMKAPPLRAVVCNAGTQSFRGLVYSKDGFENTFAVNHLTHFLLVHCLLPMMREPARVVFVASGTHDPDTLDGRFVPPFYETAEALAFPEQHGQQTLSGIRRYSTSKLCNILCAYEFARRLKEQGRSISVNAYDPGATPGTGLSRSYPLIMRILFSKPLLKLLRVRNYTAEVSGAAMARLVLDPALEGKTGRYFHVHDELRSSKDSYDSAKALDLWQTSLRLCGLSTD